MRHILWRGAMHRRRATYTRFPRHRVPFSSAQSRLSHTIYSANGNVMSRKMQNLAKSKWKWQLFWNNFPFNRHIVQYNFVYLCALNKGLVVVLMVVLHSQQRVKKYVAKRETCTAKNNNILYNSHNSNNLNHKNCI